MWTVAAISRVVSEIALAADFALARRVLCWLAAAIVHAAMPNRGPVVLSVDEVEALLDALPMPRKESDGEDADERKQIKTLEAARVRLQELKNSLDEGA